MSRLIDADVLVETLADQIKANESDTSASGMVAKEALKGFIGLVNGQPTAQPEVATDTNVPSTDCISRQAAVDALHMDIDIIPYAKAREYARAVIETVYNRLEQLPSAQPEPSQIARDIATIIENEQDMRVILAQPQRMRGRWNWHEDEDICNCSKCDFEINAEGCVDPYEYVKIYNFCPNCGAQMDGGEQEGEIHSDI